MPRRGSRTPPVPFAPPLTEAFWLLEAAAIPARWNEALHPRDQFGKWIDKAGGLAVGGKLQLDSKTTLSKDKDGTFRVTRSGAITKGFIHPADAVRAAADKSAKSKELDSVGGETSHKDLNAYLKSRGTPAVDASAQGIIQFGGSKLGLTLAQADAELVHLRQRLAMMRFRSDEPYVARAIPTVEAREAELARKLGVPSASEQSPAAKTPAAALTLDDKTPGFANVYDGRRTIGTVRRPDFAPAWTARLADGTVIGQSATREGALAHFTRRREATQKAVAAPAPPTAARPTETKAARHLQVDDIVIDDEGEHEVTAIDLPADGSVTMGVTMHGEEAGGEFVYRLDEPVKVIKRHDSAAVLARAERRRADLARETTAPPPGSRVTATVRRWDGKKWETVEAPATVVPSASTKTGNVTVRLASGNEIQVKKEAVRPAPEAAAVTVRKHSGGAVSVQPVPGLIYKVGPDGDLDAHHRAYRVTGYRPDQLDSEGFPKTSAASEGVPTIARGLTKATATRAAADLTRAAGGTSSGAATVPGDATPDPRRPAVPAANPMNVPAPDSRFARENLDAVDTSAIVGYDKEASHHAYSVHTPPELKAQWQAAYERTQAALIRAGRKKSQAPASGADVPKLALETDTALAELHNRAYALQDQLARVEHSAKQQAGAKFYYRGRQRVTDMTLADAEKTLASELKKLAAHKEATAGQEHPWDGYSGVIMPYEERNARSTVEKLAETRAELEKTREAMKPLNAVYAKHHWSRFFLVTSSPGHIHSSTHCSTCRPTTRFGWLPDLSGKTEKEAVDAHGPQLCSVCFPSAPTAWTGGKLSQSDAENRAENALRSAKGQPKKYRQSELKLRSNVSGSYDGGYSVELADGSVLAGPYATKKDAEQAKRDLIAGRAVRAAG